MGWACWLGLPILPPFFSFDVLDCIVMPLISSSGSWILPPNGGVAVRPCIWRIGN